jgi:V8-like Glu-specific endopeptidase
MRFFIAILLIQSNCLLANAFSINTDNTEYHQFKTSRDLKIKNGMASVSGVKYNHSSEEYIDGGRKFSVPIEVFKRAKKLSKSVFAATPGDTGGHGTAFHAGGNFILTNQHVLSPNRRNSTECKTFSIKLRYEQVNQPWFNKFFAKRSLSCKKVHFCSRSLDFCLIEMADHKKGFNLKNNIAPKLIKNSKYNPKMRAMVIGNPIGYGIHASTGFGTDIQGIYSSLLDRFHFYAPLFGGNSGGPIFNDDNQVIGIAKKQSLDLESTKAYNVGLPMETVLNILEHELKDKPEILKQINY